MQGLVPPLRRYLPDSPRVEKPAVQFLHGPFVVPAVLPDPDEGAKVLTGQMEQTALPVAAAGAGGSGEMGVESWVWKGGGVRGRHYSLFVEEPSAQRVHELWPVLEVAV
jgi:hypothetical protein